MSDAHEQPGAPPPAAKPPAWPRLLALALVLGGLVGLGRAFGLHERLTVEGVRATVGEAGAWGVLVFVVVFCLGELIHIPGLVFVAAGVLCWGQALGGAASYVAALASLALTFAVVRGVGGAPLGGLERPWVQRALARLEARPVATVALLRVVLILSPPLNYALALSPLRFRHYMLGSAVGIVPPILFAVFFFEWLLARVA